MSLSKSSTLPLQGKTALITGASQGIGRAIAKMLAARGAVVVLAARNAEKLAVVTAEIEAAGGQAKPFALDVSDEGSIKEAAKTILAAHGRVDILVNNAGITRDGLMMRMKRADWDEVLTTNLTGTFLLTQALLSPMTQPVGAHCEYRKCRRPDGPGRTGQLCVEQGSAARLYALARP
jgi:3-oxoacyl-[acyl-carrier protein] reductase